MADNTEAGNAEADYNMYFELLLAVGDERQFDMARTAVN